MKAHVIPRAFYELPEQSEGPLKLASNSPNTYPKKLPVGIYDQEIVTREGEDYFGPWDHYAATILLQQQATFDPILRGNETLAWSRRDVDYVKMKLFALAVLWRAHASTHAAFSKVNLGPHEPKIRQMLLDSNAGSEEEYSVCLARWIDDGFGPIFMDPFAERYDGRNYYRFYCGRLVIYVKVDQRKTRAKFSDMQLAPGRDLYLVARKLKRSKEWPLMVRIAHANKR